MLHFRFACETGAAAAAPHSPPASGMQGPAPTSHQISYIVLLRDGADPNALAASVGIEPRYVNTVINGFAGALGPEQVAELQQDPRVQLIQRT